MNQRHLVLLFAIAILGSLALADEEGDVWSFKTLKANAAKKRYDRAAEQAGDKHKKAVAAADTQLTADLNQARLDLHAALTDAKEAAFKARNVDEVVRLDKAIAQMKAGNAPAGAAAHGAPPDAVRFGGHHYKVFDETVPFPLAVERCRKLGGRLLRIDTAGEQEFIAKTLNGLGDKAARWYWIDATDAASEGEWRHLDGDPIRKTHWAKREPDNGGDLEHWAVIARGIQWRWADVDAGRRDVPFICEWGD